MLMMKVHYAHGDGVQNESRRFHFLFVLKMESWTLSWMYCHRLRVFSPIDEKTALQVGLMDR
jgi:hypothetical protein